MPPAASVRMQPRLEEDAGVRWLLSSGDPSVRFRTLTEIVGRSAVSPRAASARRDILAGPRVAALLAVQQADGGFGVHPYQKCTGYKAFTGRSWRPGRTVAKARISSRRSPGRGPFAHSKAESPAAPPFPLPAAYLLARPGI